MAWATSVDKGVEDIVDILMGTKLDPSQVKQIYLNIREGGLGMGSAALRAESAWVGAWEGGLDGVAQALEISSLATFKEQWPEWGRVVEPQDRALAAKCNKPAPGQRWEALLGGGLAKRQRTHAAKVHEHQQATLHAEVGAVQSLKIKMASGLEAGTWLQNTAEDEEEPLPDTQMRVCIKRRLRMEKPAGSDGKCHLMKLDRSPCSLQCCSQAGTPDGGHHALICPLGGGTIRRHNAVRDALARWLLTIGRPNMKEQDIARWMKDGERAMLDIVLRDPRLGEVSVDVCIIDAAHLDSSR